MNYTLSAKAWGPLDMNYGRQTEPTSCSSKMSILQTLAPTAVSVLEHNTTLAQPNSKYLAITCYLLPMAVRQAQNYGLLMELQQAHSY